MEKEYSIPDIETGFRIPVSKEAYEMYMSLWEITKPVPQNVKGTIVVFGTAGDMEDGMGISEMFYNRSCRSMD